VKFRAADHNPQEPQGSGSFRPDLFEAMNANDTGRCRELLLRQDFLGVNCKEPDCNRTALHIMARFCEEEDIGIALFSRADFTEANHVDSVGQTALHFAAVTRKVLLCLALLSRPDKFNNVNAVSVFGETALDVAMSRGLDTVCAAIRAHPSFHQQ
jgi:hypothetical protein